MTARTKIAGISKDVFFGCVVPIIAAIVGAIIAGAFGLVSDSKHEPVYPTTQNITHGAGSPIYSNPNVHGNIDYNANVPGKN